MSYCTISQVSGVDRCTRGTACLCGHLHSEGKTHVGSGTLYHPPGFTGISSSSSGAQAARLVDMPFEARQPEPMQRSGAFDNPQYTEVTHNASSSITHYRRFAPNQPEVTQPFPTPPRDVRDHDDDRPNSIEPANFLESMFSLAWAEDQPNRARTPQAHGLIEPAEPDVDSDAPEEPDPVQSAMVGFLSLDRNVESNSLPFILQAYSAWMNIFLFEPLRVADIFRNDISHSYVLGEDYRQLMNLLAVTVYDVTRSSDYDPVNSPSSFMSEVILRRRLGEAGARVETSRDRDRRLAQDAMLKTCEFIAGLCNIGSLSRILSFMQFTAPIFRRACPGPLDELANLPALLVSMVAPLQFFSTFDVLLGALTGRPMFFRYAVNFSPELPEALFLLENGPGMRWKYGFPDRLLLTLGKMNGLYEDFGPNVPIQLVDELEEEIKRTQPIVSDMDSPVLAMGRMVVQECWILAALIYLYMGLCGASSTDARVAKVRTKFMRVLASVRPRRNVDSFLVFPMIILGLATNNWDERTTIQQRLLGVPECSRPGIFGNDFVRMLGHVWSKGSRVVWSDLRQACWEVSGM
ncbi:unnamed protein product [Rhizoctonia solani]|uniref:Fungal-specific transcription factor domain protein n=3 Tax=Rhizoctonia solani TaxID=456999 RepID=A0A8H3BAL1_9AGAM|nr:fungal-specific transcription factor domain protein [Rhizoctonia solani AG-3 Rhs1AP]KEP47793.1 fungal-specific transcription factor domain protein [Rhizoctonia solani 123E]CAE6437067.1 unnamed protein product [Rhizoctonia solani]CAE6451977.1 unnamed protein product [Rhizoctonia solani]